MTDRVVAFPGQTVPLQGEPDQEVIEALEEVLDLARAGIVTGIAFAATTATHMRRTNWAVRAEFTHDLAAALLSLELRFTMAMDKIAEAAVSADDPGVA